MNSLSLIKGFSNSNKVREDSTFYVFIFYSTECPICLSSIAQLKEVYSKFEGRGVIFNIIFPGKYFTTRSILRFRRTLEVKFNMYQDPLLVVAKRFNATTTPEVFLTDKNLNIYYSGQIDNMYTTVGDKRFTITKYYLKDAIDSLVHRKLPAVKRTEPVGCFISYN